MHPSCAPPSLIFNCESHGTTAAAAHSLGKVYTHATEQKAAIDNGKPSYNPLHGRLHCEHSCKLHDSHQMLVNSPARYKMRTRSPQLEEPVGQRQGHRSVSKPLTNPNPMPRGRAEGAQVRTQSSGSAAGAVRLPNPNTPLQLPTERAQSARARSQPSWLGAGAGAGAC